MANHKGARPSTCGSHQLRSIAPLSLRAQGPSLLVLGNCLFLVVTLLLGVLLTSQEQISRWPGCHGRKALLNQTIAYRGAGPVQRIPSSRCIDTPRQRVLTDEVDSCIHIRQITNASACVALHLALKGLVAESRRKRMLQTLQSGPGLTFDPAHLLDVQVQRHRPLLTGQHIQASIDPWSPMRHARASPPRHSVVSLIAQLTCCSLPSMPPSRCSRISTPTQQHYCPGSL